MEYKTGSVSTLALLIVLEELFHKQFSFEI